MRLHIHLISQAKLLIDRIPYFILKIHLFPFILTQVFSFSLLSAQDSDIALKQDSVNLNELVKKVRSIKDTNYVKAYYMAIEGLKKYKPENNTIGRIRLLQLTAEIEYYYKSKFDKSILHLNEMKHLSDSIGFKGGIPWAQLNMANMYYYQNDFIKSMELYNDAIYNAKLVNDSIIVLNAMNGVAGLFYIDDKTDTALTILKECLFYAERNEIFESLIYIYEDLALLHQKLNNLDSAIYYHKKNLELLKRKNRTYTILTTRVNLAHLKYLKNRSYNPIPELTRLQKQCKEYGFYRIYYETGYILSVVLEYYKRYQESLIKYKEAHFIEDSITANEKIRKVAESESDYYLEKKEFENRELNRINEINELKLRNRKIIIALISFILMQAFILLYFLYKKYKTIKEQERKIFEQERKILEQEKEKITQQLDYKQRELAIKTLKIFQVNQLIDDLSVRLYRLRAKIRTKNKIADELRNDIQLMMNEIRGTANSKIWEEVEFSFNEANPDFLNWLHKNYPNLTSNEIKLCIFSLLHLNTKDMSSILMKSNRSVQSARLRLRKKLNINDSKASLSVYLNKMYLETKDK